MAGLPEHGLSRRLRKFEFLRAKIDELEEERGREKVGLDRRAENAAKVGEMRVFILRRDDIERGREGGRFLVWLCWTGVRVLGCGGKARGGRNSWIMAHKSGRLS